MQKLFYLIILIISISCESYHNEFYVDPLNIDLTMESLGGDLYRLHLDKEASKTFDNYIDFRYNLCEMPCLALYFPYGKSDTIYVREDTGRIESYHCEDYQIVLQKPMSRDAVHKKGLSITYDKNYRRFILADSSLIEVPCIYVLLYTDMSYTSVDDKINNIGYRINGGVKETYPLGRLNSE